MVAKNRSRPAAAGDNRALRALSSLRAPSPDLARIDDTQSALLYLRERLRKETHTALVGEILALRDAALSRHFANATRLFGFCRVPSPPPRRLLLDWVRLLTSYHDFRGETHPGWFWWLRENVEDGWILGSTVRAPPILCLRWRVGSSSVDNARIYQNGYVSWSFCEVFPSVPEIS